MKGTKGRRVFERNGERRRDGVEEEPGPPPPTGARIGPGPPVAGAQRQCKQPGRGCAPCERRRGATPLPPLSPLDADFDDWCQDSLIAGPRSRMRTERKKEEGHL
ncbi:hypothetical protein MRX96_054334 [Rhipicephalus microplus]